MAPQSSTHFLRVNQWPSGLSALTDEQPVEYPSIPQPGGQWETDNEQKGKIIVDYFNIYILTFCY